MKAYIARDTLMQIIKDRTVFSRAQDVPDHFGWYTPWDFAIMDKVLVDVEECPLFEILKLEKIDEVGDLVAEKYAKTTREADRMLSRLIGDNGNGGYLGELTQIDNPEREKIVEEINKIATEALKSANGAVLAAICRQVCSHKSTRSMPWPDGKRGELCLDCLKVRILSDFGNQATGDWEDHGYKSVADWYDEAALAERMISGIQGNTIHKE